MHGPWSHYAVATYRVWDTKADWQKKAQGIALGLTIGSWTDVPATRQKEMEAHCGHVVSIDELDASTDARAHGQRCADIRIAYPEVNLSMDFASILVTVFGKLSMDGAIKLIDLHVPESLLSTRSGPRFGTKGMRNLLNVHHRPLLMSIFKSVIGYELDGFSDQFAQQIAGGVDLVKDDEILFENRRTPIEKRVEACRKVIDAVKQNEDRNVLYAVHVSGTPEQVIRRAKEAVSAGANAILVNVLAYGYDLLQAIRTDDAIGVPILAHPALAGAIYPSPQHGIQASVLLGKLMRLAGADLVLFPSPYGSVVMPMADNMAIHQSLSSEWASDYVYGSQNVLTMPTAMSVPSAGIHPGLVAQLVNDFGHDVVINAGGGLFGHPDGTIAGGQAFRQAIDAVMSGQSLRHYADHESANALRIAIEKWGVRE